MVAADFREINNNTNHKHNLSLEEKKALKSLQQNTNIIIKNADKGGGVVLQNREDYLKEATGILSDKNYYCTLQKNPHTSYQLEYSTLILEAHKKGILTNKEKEFLTIKNPRMPLYYHLPKIHKDATNPPGRPIISGIGSLTSALSKYIDTFLQKYVITLDSYLKDSAALLILLKDIPWLPTYKWATLDVTALYSNIPHQLGLTAVEEYLSKDINIPITQKEFIKNGIDFILTHNLFTFNSQLFLQTKGTAMGTRFAPSYANLFMGHYENLFIQNAHPWRKHIIMYRRYIDDLIFIWDGTEDDFNTFTAYLNTNDFGVELSGKISAAKIEYLDVELSSIKDNITSKTYFKPVDSLLDYKSAHYKKWLNNVPFGQFRRLRKNCTQTQDYEEQCKIMSKRFKDKKYPEHLINEAKRRAGDLSQDQCLLPKNTPKDQETKKAMDYQHNFITTYNHSHSAINNILKQHWPILKNDPLLKTKIPDIPRLTFRREKSVKNILAPSELRKPNNNTNTSSQGRRNGIFRCYHPKCKCCSSITEGTKSNTCQSTGEIYPIKSKVDCGSSFVIYLLTCQCGLQYVGRTTQSLRTRINQHRSNSARGYLKHSVSRHAALSHSNSFHIFTVSIIEQISPEITDRFGRLQKREMFWIYKFNTLAPIGLNEALETIY